MKQGSKSLWLLGSVAATFAIGAEAQELSRTDLRLFGGDFSYNGLFRIDTAYSTTGKVNAANQLGLGSNGVPIERRAGNPATQYRTQLDDTAGIGVTPALPATLLSAAFGTPITAGAFAPTLGVSNLSPTGGSDTFTRYLPRGEQVINYHALRFETSASINWGNFSFQSRLRALYDPGALGYDEYNYNDYRGIDGGFQTAESGRPEARAYRGTPDYFGYSVDGKKNPLLFERSGKNYSIDLPAFFLQYNSGNLTARLGNQTVAWGQLLFFRLFDSANGLDLRRHLFVDRAIEEFADERASAPGLRLTYQVTDSIVADAFAQQFIPTIVPNPNTPYNIVDSRFILHDNYYKNGAYKKFNAGLRVKGDFGQYNAQAFYVNRLNPLGSIRWRKSGVDKALPNDNALGAAFNQACQAAIIPAYNLQNGTNFRTDNGCGPLIAETAFEAGPNGLNSYVEWFDRASYTKLDALVALNRLIDEFPAAQALLTAEVDNAEQAANELDAFFIAFGAGGAHGHVERDYYREHLFGLGGGFVTEGEPGSIFDQALINLEVTYTPKRVFTGLDLRQRYDKRDEIQAGLVVEKYQRFFQSVPATYMVFQYLWQKESSLEGLLLDGYGSENYTRPGTNYRLTSGVPTNNNPKITPGVSGGANYAVLAFLQPGPQYIFEYSIASLIDIQGGILVQPGIQWKPRGNVTVNLFYNYINSNVWSGNKNKSFLSFIDDRDDITVRLGYQF
ncbi:MAG: DUF1302 family protein [Pseudomonadota bacterium]